MAEVSTDMFGAIKRQNYDGALLVICVLGLVLRLVFTFSLEDRIYWSIDGADYDAHAQDLLAGRGYVSAEGDPTAYRPVGYSLFLALLYLLFGHSIVVVRVVQSIMTTALIYVLYLIAAKLFDKKSARIAALCCALYPYFIYISGVFYPTALSTFLLAFTVYRMLITGEEPTVERYTGLGALVGILLLIRPNFIAALPVFILWCFGSLKMNRKVTYKMIALAGLCMALCVLPWATRNYLKIGSFSLSTNGGRNFWLGNNAGATPSTGNEVPLTAELRREVEAARSEIEREKVYYREGMRFIKDNPGRFLSLSAGKALAFWRLYPLPSSGYKQDEGLSKLASIVSFAPLLIFAVAGFILSWKRHKKTNCMFLLLLLLFNIIHAFFISIVRLRLPIDVYLMLYAGYGIVRTYCAVNSACKNVGPAVDVVRELGHNKMEEQWHSVS